MGRILLLILLLANWHLPSEAYAQNLDKNIDSLQLVLKSAVEDSSKVNTLNLLAVQFEKTRNKQAQKQYHSDALVLSRKISFRSGEARTLNSLGVLYAKEGMSQEALEHFYLAKKIYEGLSAKHDVAHTCVSIGIVYKNQGNYPEALKYQLAALDIMQEVKDKRGMANAYNSIGIIYKNQGNYTEAIKNSEEALKLTEETGDKELQTWIYTNIGNAHKRLGNFPEALKNHLSALKINQELGNKRGLAGVYANIGNIYSNLNDNSSALKNYQDAMKIDLEFGNKKDICAGHMNMAIIYKRLGNYNEALAHYQPALKTAEEMGDKRLTAMVYLNLGNLNVELGDDIEALRNYQYCLKISEEIGTKESLSHAFYGIGDILLRQGQNLENTIASKEKYAEAVEYFHRGLTITEEMGSKLIMSRLYRTLSESHKLLEDYPAALEYLTKHIELSDSIRNDEKTLQLEKLQTEYEVEKAVYQEKTRQELALTAKNIQHQLDLANAEAKKDKAISIERLKYDFALEAEKTRQEQTLAAQKFRSEKANAEENARHELAIATERGRQEILTAERKRKTEIFLGTLALLSVIVVFALLLIRQRNAKQKAIEKARVIHKMAELELQSLRAQLNPHFMFNSLNAIQELILLEDNDRSHTYLARFAKLLRMLLENANHPFIPLARETEFLELYLTLEKLRIPDLIYSIQIDPRINTEQIKIPNMILQPYIENAIWHGLSHKAIGDRKIKLSATVKDDYIQYDIEDNGVGRKKAEELKSVYRKDHKSKGMELLTKRFKLLNQEYRHEIYTNIIDLSENGIVAGTKVSIGIPIELGKDIKLQAS